MANETTTDVIKVMRLLRDRRNVLISGAPGTGKSRLLANVAKAFETSSFVDQAAAGPVHVPGAAVAIPEQVPGDMQAELQDVLPAPARTNRQVFRTTFHQNSKYREFVSGLVPVTTPGETGFRVMPGTLYRASEHAKAEEGASLLVIDEINRGPAVQVFGGSIVAIEPDKRLADDNGVRPLTQFFEIVDPDTGNVVEYALPEHLYILAAMNQADTSVEPLDVAFLRRWANFRLQPAESVLTEFFGLGSPAGEIPEQANAASDVYRAAVRAWQAINDRVRLGRGAEFQIGHGIFLIGGGAPPQDLDDAKQFVAEAWSYVQAHVDEVFFGDIRGIAAVLNVIGGPNNHLYLLEETTFADEPRLDLTGPNEVTADNIYPLLRAVIG
ncbi:MAG: AAA family ATPase [Pseudomonadota bacterium]